LVFKSKEEKNAYAKKIAELIHNSSIDNKVFGVGIDKLIEREKPKDGIPQVVKLCADFIRTSNSIFLP
jgi:hypothetical protein